MTIARYVHTLRYLRPQQIVGRAWFRFYRPAIDRSLASDPRKQQGRWIWPVPKQQSLLDAGRCRLLGQTHDISSASVWNDQGRDMLWLYNLHYFDDLNAIAASERSRWHRVLVERWIRENPAGQGAGWDPFPTSLRIVNWIKWALREGALPDGWRQSLAEQLRWLMGRLEWHLLGNHLLANAKALVFGGCYFSGPEARRWLDMGFRILARELREQVLPDGGHFERSPMYHALVLEDLLDIINMCRAFRAADERWPDVVNGLPAVAERMQRWLAVMCHPDGEIAFFNDAAIGIAPAPAELTAYGSRLELTAPVGPADGVTHLADSGYIRLQRHDAVVLLDVAPVGPDYQPGHAHADTLSFELSLSGHRLLVNSGTSCYGTGPERQRQRGTAAHNTVVVDGQDSSEVWSGFRVARRAKPFGLEIREGNEETVVSCAHDGYRRLPGRVVHRRSWRLSAHRLAVRDELIGSWHSATAHYHLHPAVIDGVAGDRESLQLGGGRRFEWQSQDGPLRLAPNSYHPGFGISDEGRRLSLSFQRATCETTFSWT